ncbi:hypothetical protein GCM10007160_17190 [Litchfieldella qijiaojingensis]|uniref:LapA adhesin domain-containing protein n=1 Tax=Litchfieldella qijiaojingensis TaxID=980347 RepID=A0ABQ2YPQ0_9GAMM|nr:retention module-containing protein [Halomonas qijiaojingensis]GGX90302.1 hypothetical protein GCM10007160_17190 [Halomonas qijiaojingensis]
MSIATVLSITGQAWVRDDYGNLRELSPGDVLQEGETLVTSDTGSVQLDFGDGLEPALIGPGQQVAMTPELDAETPVDVAESSVLDEDLEALLVAIDEDDGDLLELLDATAAGAGGGGAEGGGHDFVRLARITESVDPLAFEFGSAQTAEFIDAEGDGLAAAVTDEQETTPEPTPNPTPTPSPTPTPTPTPEPVETTITLNSDADTVVEGQPITLTATTSTAPTGSPLVITLTNGMQIVIPVGQTSASIQIDSREDDAYRQGNETESFGIGSVSGGGFDQVTLGEDVDATVVDDSDTTTITLTAPEQVTEGEAITVTATVDNAPETDLIIELSNGETITIAAGVTSGNVTFESPDVPDGGGTLELSIADTTGGNYENLDENSTVEVKLTGDSIPVFTLEPGASEVDEAGLPGGSDAGSDSHTSSGSFTIDTGNDTLTSLTINGQNVTGGGTVQGVYGTLVVTLNEDGSYGWSYTLDGATEGDEVQESFELVATDSDGSTSDGSLTIDIVDDIPSVSISGAAEATEGSESVIGSWSVTEGADGATTVVEYDGVTYQLGDTITTASGELTVATDGTWTFVPGVDTDNDDITFTLVTTDGDGDEARDSHTIAVSDGSGPTPGDEAGAGGSLSLLLDDVDTLDDATDSDSGQLSFTAGSDAITGFAFGNPSNITVTGLDGELSWAIDSDGNLIGSLDGTDVLKLSLNGSAIAAQTSGTVAVSAELLSNLPHGVNVDSLGISGIEVVASDDDGDSATGTLTIDVSDDGPQVAPVRTALMANEQGLSLTDEIPFTFGADQQGAKVALSGNNDGTYWLNPETGQRLSSEGNDLLYREHADGSLDAYYLDDANNEVVVFTVAYNADGSYTLTQLGHLDGSQSSLLVGFSSGFGGGNSGEPAYFSSSATIGESGSIIVMAQALGDDTVNYNNNALGVSEGSTVDDPSETLALTFYDGEGWSTSGNGSNATVNEPTGGAQPLAVFSITFSFWGLDTGEMPTFWKDSGQQEAFEANDNGDGTWTVTSDEAFDTVYVSALDNTGNGFGVASAEIVTIIEGTDQTLELSATITDGDGDQATTSWNFTLDADGDVLRGTEGNDFIQGNGSDDALDGSGGDDILIGGPANDTLMGGLGADTFVWNLGDQGEEGNAAIDEVMDFSSDEGDKLDLSDLLQERDSDISNYLHASDDGEGGTLIHVSTSGGFADGYDAGAEDQTIHLKGVQYDAELIQDMLNNGQLTIDQ